MTGDFLPYGRQEISDADIDAVTEALRAPLITQGPRVQAFERGVAQYLGARHVVAFSSGTAALHAAAHAAGIGFGDEAVVAPITFAASSNCVLYQGGTVRFADIAPDTWCLDASAAMAATGPRTKAIIPVSLAGLPVEVAGLDPIRGDVLVIEDACHALGAHRGGRMVGGPGGADITCFSLHPVKSLTTGEGGLATTEDDELAASMRRFRTHGIEREDVSPGPTDGPWYMEMQELGFNYRITDFQCALGLSQLDRLESWVGRRNEIAAQYRDRLAGEERLRLPPAAPEGSRHGYHLFVVGVREGAGKRRVVFEGLREAGIGVQVHYIPVYRMPYYRDTLGFPQDTCPHAEGYYAAAISLPMFPAMSEADVDRVATELERLL